MSHTPEAQAGNLEAIEDQAATAGVSRGEALRVWMKIGWLSFGGPAGQIALMHRILVEEKAWVSEKQYLHALNFCMLLPGPEAQQLATYIGWLLHGIRGGLVAGLMFILPGFLVILALSYAYVTVGEFQVVQGLFMGLKAAVIAIVLQALVRLSSRALGGALRTLIAMAAFAAIFMFDVSFPWIICAAALLGWAALRGTPTPGDSAGRETRPETVRKQGPASLHHLDAAIVLAILWFLPVMLIVAGFGGDHVFTQIATFFSKMAVVTFGGAYAVLSYVAQEAVQVYGWLTPGQMIDGLAMAETTPGPLIMVVQFVGFMAGHGNPGSLAPWLAALAGSVLTTWVTFAPCFLWIFLGAPYIERIRHHRPLSAAFEAVTAAVVGVIANLALWFSMHVVFQDTTRLREGPLTMEVPVWASMEPVALGLTVLGLGLVFYWRTSVLITLLWTGVLGALLGALVTS